MNLNHQVHTKAMFKAEEIKKFLCKWQLLLKKYDIFPNSFQDIFNYAKLKQKWTHQIQNFGKAELILILWTALAWKASLLLACISS